MLNRTGQIHLLGECLGKQCAFFFLFLSFVNAIRRRFPFFSSFLDAYLDRFDFVGLGLDDALRNFLASFVLPGEAQQVDRIMEKFSRRYHQTNPTIFAHPGTSDDHI